MLDRHAPELLFAGFRELHAKGSLIGGIRLSQNKPFGLERIRDASDVSARDHEASRKLAHLETLRRALKLRHKIKPRQRDAELRLQPLPHVVADEARAGQKTQPDAQGLMMVARHSRLNVEDRRDAPCVSLRLRHTITSPPAMVRH